MSKGVTHAVELHLDGRHGGWSLRFDPSGGPLDAGRATLSDSTEILADLESATDQVRAFANSRVPGALYLPSADLDLGWSLVFFPADGTVLVHNPFGETVGGLRLQRGFEFINALRAAVGTPVG